MLKIVKSNVFFRYYLTLTGFQNVGTNIYNLIFVVYLASIYNSKLFVGLADSIVYIPALFGIWLGFLADKTRRKSQLLIGTSLLQGFLFLLVAYVIQYKGVAVIALIASLNIFSDLLSAYLGELIRPIFKNNVADEELESAYALLSASGLTLAFASQMLGVWLLATSGNNYQLLAVLNALCFFIVALLYWKMRNNLTYKVTFDEDKSQKPSLKQQFQELYQTSQEIFRKAENISFIPLITAVILSNVLGVSLGVFMNITFLEAPLFGLDYAKSLAVLGFVQIAGSFFGSTSINLFWKDFSYMQWTLLQAVVFVAMGILGFVKVDSAILVLAFGLVTFCVGRSGPKFSAMMTRHVPDHQLGMVNSFVSTWSTLSLPLATVSFSFLNSYSTPLSWLVFLVLALALVLLVVKYTIKARA